ncbi:hypothetical protein R1sor_024128 [Riccia sorocarpa]|uniref:Uncharacterized protein n=1 Tax=Riccia sorocarpa TaxID=122646 RepID=A0ABD3GSL5_9MARC
MVTGSTPSPGHEVAKFLMASRFAQEVVGFSQEEADKLSSEQVDLEMLSEMSRDDFREVLKCTWGRAKRLVEDVERSRRKVTMFEDKLSSKKSDRTKGDRHKLNIDKKMSSKSLSDNSQRLFQGEHRKGADVKIPQIPDIVSSGNHTEDTDQPSLGVKGVGSDLKQERIKKGQDSKDGITLPECVNRRAWSLKPKDGKASEWGTAYLGKYHPRSKQTYLEIHSYLRKKFADVTQPEVQTAWTENFCFNKGAEESTLVYIGKLCDEPEFPIMAYDVIKWCTFSDSANPTHAINIVVLEP